MALIINILRSWLLLFRAKNLLFLLIIQVIVLIFIDKFNFSDFYFFFGFNIFFYFLFILSVLVVTAAGNLINDYYDQEIDKINKPSKATIGLLISPKAIICVYICLNLISIFIAFFVIKNILFLLIVFCSIIILWAYSFYFKKTMLLGNIIVSLMSGSSILVLYFIAHKNLFELLSIAFFAFVCTFIREIIKDIEDINGDRVFGCKTAPIVLGVFKTKKILYSLLILLLLMILGSYKFFEIQIYIYWIVVLIPFVILLFYKIKNASEKKDFTLLSHYLKIMMALGVLGLMFNAC